jgi:uncharacterized protein (DUF1697 family)
VIRVYDAAGNVIETHEHKGRVLSRPSGLPRLKSRTMSRYIALLRAINAGRGRTVKMQPLRQVFESLGLSRVTTFIASGNVIFEATTRDTKTLERKIEKRVREVLGYKVPTFIRREAELAKIANYQPFRQSKLDAAVSINIIFLADRLNQRLKQRVRELRTNTDAFQVHGREIYWLRRRKQNGSPFSTVPLEKTLSRPFTIRGANTIKKIASKYCSSKTR